MTDERLARALDVFLHSQEAGVSRAQALTDHPELTDLLTPLFDEGVAPPAEQVFGDYRVVRELGRGGTAAVYEAVQRSLGRRVAIKVLSEVATASPTQVARFRREALALARLEHPHVVRVYDVGETEGRHWLAMELIDGGTLADRIAECRAGGGHQGASLRTMVETVATIAEALEHVHRAGIVHRDVKPSNILLRHDGTALLSDFGLARSDAAPSVTRAGIVAGTPHYMSPEHVTGKSALVPASDVFSLGATLFECATLSRAFDAETTEAVLHRILLQPTPDPRRLQPALPRDLAAIVGKALEKDVARRYATAGALAADLRAFLELRPVAARLPSPLRRLARWLRREPLRMALAAALVAAGFLGAAMVAQWPQLRAAAAANAEREFERTLEHAWAIRWTPRREECRAAFHRLLELKPHDAEALTQLSFGIRSLEGDEAALSTLEAGRAAVAETGLVDRARALLLQARGRTAEAAALASALPPPRTPVELWFAGSVELAAAGADTARARRAFEQISLAVRLSPTPRLPLVLQWAIAAVTVGDADGMREAQRTLLELWPEHPLALHHAARTLQNVDPERAARLCARGRELGMDEELSRWWEYVSWDKAGLPEHTLRAARACLACTRDGKRRTVLLDALIKLGDRAGAQAAAEAWLASEPDNVQARFFCAQAVAATYPERALDLLAELVEVAPHFAAALHALAHEQIKLGERAAALESLRRAVTAEPDFAPAHVTLVELLELAGDFSGVLAEWQRWVELHPDEAEAHWGVAAASCNVQPPRFAEALVAAMRANELAGGKRPEILATLAVVHEKLGESASAAACRERARALRASQK